jgi:hypothetical protein
LFAGTPPELDRYDVAALGLTAVAASNGLRRLALQPGERVVVNVAARPAAKPGAGAVLASEAAFQAAGLDLGNQEKRALQLKGKSDAVSVSVWQA